MKHRFVRFRKSYHFSIWPISIIPLTASMDTYPWANYSAISVQTLFKEFITNMNKIISSDRYNFKSVYRRPTNLYPQWSLRSPLSGNHIHFWILANPIIPLTATTNLYPKWSIDSSVSGNHITFEFGQFHHTFNGLHGHISLSKILGDLSADSI